MKKDSSTTTRKANSPRAVIVWPTGLEHPAIVYPAGGSDEVDEEIRIMLCRLLCRFERRTAA